MNRPFALALAGACFLAAVPLHAEEPPHLEFVKGLRDRHYPDLALEYLRKLSQNPPADIAARLPLEIARTQLDIAAASPDVAQRLALYLEARKQFDEFIAKNPKSPLANQAKLELARVSVLQGTTQLAKALREDNPQSRIAEANKARALLEDAGKQLKTVAELLDKQAQGTPDGKTAAEKAEKKEVEDAVLRAELDLALNLLDQAKTYVDESKDDVLLARGKVVQQAMPILRKAADRDDKNPLSWIAHAWLGRCYQETGQSKDARKKYAEILGQPGKQAEEGKRLARYFRMLVIAESPEPTEKQPYREIKDAAIRWLSDYAAYTNSPEGLGVRYMLAQADVRLAGEQKVKTARLPFLNEAKAQCKLLEQTDNDFAIKARKLKIAIIDEEGGLKGDVKKLTTFDDCYIRAQYEDAQLDKKGVTEEQRKEHLKTIVEALTHGLDLVEKKKQKAPEDEVNNAYTALAFAYMSSGKLLKAIEVGEKLARLPARPPQSARAAIYALHCYSQVIADPERANVSPEDVKEYRDKLRSLAEYAKKNWPTETASDVARHELGLVCIREENYPAAVEELAAIRPGYAGAILAHYQMAMAAFEAENKKLKSLGTDRRSFEQRGVAALESLPELPKSAEPGLAYTYLLAKIKLGEHLYPLKKFDAMMALAEPLLARLGDLNLDNDMREKARTGLTTIALWARYGKAEEDYGAGRFEEVAKMLAPVVAEASAGKLPEMKSNDKLRSAILGLGLRSNIQLGKLDDAQKVLDLMQSLTADNELGGGSTATLIQVAQLLRQQVEEIRKRQPDKLAKTIESFSKFLDKLTEQQKGKGLTPEIRVLLASSYSSLDNHKRAAEMLREVPEPKADAPQKDRDAWQVFKVMYIRELRLDNQVPEAKKELEAIQATWGAKSLDAQKEKLHILMAEEQWFKAARGWDGLVKMLVARITQPGMKDQYFECYYYLTLCMYKHASNMKDDTKKQAGLRQAASFIGNLEVKWPDLGGDASKARFTGLLEKEAPLKEQYDKLKQEQAGKTNGDK